ncbi:hypothetical protein [Flavobacterium aurantiibacter]|uniref:DUF2231 domain-containing protein n=1 Tax=Flavobacterium aurantiibacter TaxID=2023067 RepID=A0A255ZJ92_9FLAO|nr:hypothetical protein [Flavobacterium aurantiibacter]OYQ41501.1 hypothetical protein CHX27_13030 [Flavobacterium aurantiibacter]
MNAAHWHLALNHLPLILPIAGLLVLGVGFFTKSEVVKRTALFLFVVCALSTLAAMRSGEEAEEFVEELAGFSHDFIHEHEEAAERFALVAYALGALSLVGLWASYKRKGFARAIFIAAFPLAVVALWMGRETGTSGGEIRHTEIRETANQTPATPETQEAEAEHE